MPDLRKKTDSASNRPARVVVKFFRFGEGDAEGRFAIFALVLLFILRFALTIVLAGVSVWGAVHWGAE